jgi:hypothetical protein
MRNDSCRVRGSGVNLPRWAKRLMDAGMRRMTVCTSMKRGHLHPTQSVELAPWRCTHQTSSVDDMAPGRWQPSHLVEDQAQRLAER